MAKPGTVYGKAKHDDVICFRRRHRIRVLLPHGRGAITIAIPPELRGQVLIERRGRQQKSSIEPSA